MSKSQGDRYKTYTDKNLNEYRDKLNEKLIRLVDEKEKWTRVNDEFMILCTCGNEIDNKNGGWKWQGWEIAGQYYRVTMYEMGSLRITENHITVTGLPVLHFTTSDKDEANLHYKICKSQAII